jgi:hypothetical protein
MQEASLELYFTFFALAGTLDFATSRPAAQALASSAERPVPVAEPA